MTEREERLLIAACVAVERWREMRAMQSVRLWREFQMRADAFEAAMRGLEMETTAALYAQAEAG